MPDTVTYADGDTVELYTSGLDSITVLYEASVPDSLMENAWAIEWPDTRMLIRTTHHDYTVNQGVFGVNLTDFFEDDHGNVNDNPVYTAIPDPWEALITLAPKTIRIFSGAGGKFMHPLGTPQDPADPDGIWNGGYGYSEEYPAVRAYRDARINRIFEGTNEINRLLTVDMLLKRVMKGQLDMLGPAMAVQKELMGIPEFGEGGEGLFYEEEKALKNMKKAFFMVAGAAVQKLMMALKDEQEILMCAADMMNEIFLAESMLLRVQKLALQRGEEAIAIHRDMLQVFFTDSIDRLNKQGKNAIAAFATGDEQRMMLLGLKRFTKYPVINTTAARRRIADKLIAENKYCF